ncbi:MULTISPECIES: 50S ribosomal protein L4 [Desulfococcus]|jgi:large subunit ribosomal protein L4|uniref:Large ribosomal subunit protein uL4 n=1 Tax=Desulfococcus multivorans DSM 2059 TaxID=1121405 RepID=S7UHD1_DESML|nr:50S ribosomal protein L4 [Desulfococcus multivorans]AOY59754.1 RplD: 50S ribosomal protein L4 [Desulfococcus multivorans]AQV01928.1 50S ribosomal protein L4 [Desulfococcus multivorans]EPR33239.1 ribosomal protein L4/L1e [Desulfococcus multivorans DSM 2059]MDX9817460.1 50S ribosomal protein L4 [Desulfococcus multivorans]SKA23505.1 LSU ribosomal protein L4P [Desulfococcus multivorans DSM 2059]
MAVVDVLNSKGEKVSQVELSDEIFSVPVKPGVLHEVVTMQLASRRSGSASVKRRGDVAGSTKKLFRQKGTGRARRGNIKSPLLRGGGVVFGPSPKSYAYKVPKKVRRMALKMALSSKLQENELTVVDQLELDRIKTKAFAEVIRALNKSNVLLVTDAADEKLVLSSRNLPNVKVIKVEGLNVYDILKYRDIILLEPAVKAIEGRLSA